MAEGGQTRVVALLQITLRSGIDHLHVRCSGYGVPVTRYSALMFDGEGFHLSRTCCMPRRKPRNGFLYCIGEAFSRKHAPVAPKAEPGFARFKLGQGVTGNELTCRIPGESWLIHSLSSKLNSNVIRRL